jgi:hypothetical protein
MKASYLSTVVTTQEFLRRGFTKLTARAWKEARYIFRMFLKSERATLAT